MVEVGSELVGGGGRSLSRSMVAAAGAEWEPLCREEGSEREAGSVLVGAWDGQNAKMRWMQRVAFLGTVGHKHNDVGWERSWSEKCSESQRTKQADAPSVSEPATELAVETAPLARSYRAEPS